MRSLATSTYTDAQIQAQLRAPSVADSCRFDILDNQLNVVGSMDTVTAGVVELDVDRKIKGSLTLTMLPDSQLVGMFLKRKIRPWYRLTMPDGGIAEWPMGVYVWTRPQRSLDAEGVEVWSVTLGDQSHLLDLAGPGPTGITFPSGQRIVDALVYVISLVGLSDASGIASLDTMLNGEITWTYGQVKPPVGDAPSAGDTPTQQQPVTLLDVAAQLHNGAGIYGPWFDLTGRYRAMTVPDLATVEPSTTYATTADSIMLGLDTDSDFARFANRVTVRYTGTAWSAAFYQADADVLYPGHPASHASTSFYVDAPPIDDTIHPSLVEIRRHAISELHQRLSFDSSLTVPTMANPAHEAFDVIGIQWDGDSEYSSSTRFYERRWAFDLFGGSKPMEHKLNRLYG